MIELDPSGPVIKACNVLIPIGQIREIDIAKIEQQVVAIHTLDGKTHHALGFDAIEIVLQLKPSALEGKRLKWRQGAWSFHNIFGHWGLQCLVWFGFKKAGIRWHDYTTPRMRDLKTDAVHDRR